MLLIPIKNHFEYLIFFIIIVSLEKAKLEIENIILEDNQLIKNNIIENKYFYLKHKFQNTLPNYIKIILIPENLIDFEYINYMNYLISYYQNDSSFTNRKLLSYSSFNNSIMWLTKEQIKNGFYLSFECSEIPCNYSFIISPKNYIELYFGEQYTYFVTKENKKMIFIFKGKKDQLNNNDTISIWGKGNKDLSFKFKDLNYEKYPISIKNTYFFEYDNITDYLFELKANEGDNINVGSLICRRNENNICQLGLIYEGIEYSGFLKKNILENNCFSRKILKTEFFKFIGPNNEILNSFNINDYFCIKIPEKYDEILYNLIGYGYKNKKPLENKLYPIIPGINYIIEIQKNKTIGFYSSRINDLYNAESLTYKIYTAGANTSANILFCDNYPLCDLNKSKNNNFIPLKKFYTTYSFSYIKNEFEENWSPINKNQKILIFTCNKGILEDEFCEININIYTDKTLLEIKQMYIQHILFIREGIMNNLAIENGGIITIETFSGNISLITNDTFNYLYEYKNMHSFLVNNTNNYFLLKIKAEKNSVYSIKFHYIYEGNYKNIIKFFFGGNYLFNFYESDNIILKPDDDYFSLDDKILPSYFSLYPIECNIDIQYMDYNKNLDNYSYFPLELENSFYQDIYLEEDKKGDAIFVKSLNNRKQCKIFVSSYKLENKSQELFNSGIFLEENFPQLFIFNKKYNEMKYIYFHPNINENINITFNLKNGGKYEMFLFLEEKESKKIYGINSTQSILIEKNEWKDICQYAQQICKISFLLINQDIEKESIIEIIINENIKKEKSESKLNTILFIVIPIAALIIIIIIILLIIKYKKNRNIQEEIEKVPEIKLL